MGVFGEQARKQVDTVGDVSRFIALQVEDALAKSREYVLAVHDREEDVVSGLGEHPFHDHVVGG